MLKISQIRQTMQNQNLPIYDPMLTQGMRRQMVERLKQKGITDSLVLDAMNQVPRHLFMDKSLEMIAYEERSLAIARGQTISQPLTVAFQSQLLELKPRNKVLEIGTGSGYQTAILYHITQRVYTMERQKELYMSAKKVFDELNIHPRCFFSDGFQGLPGFAPFDRILVTCAAPYIPQMLVAQLKVGGTMVVPVGDKSQKMIRLTKIDESQTKTEEFGDFRFVPMLENKAN